MKERMSERWSKTGEPPVSYEEAVRRVKAKIGGYFDPCPPKWLAMIVWPKNRMRAQGAAFAVGKIARRMEQDGWIRYVVHENGTRGWVRGPGVSDRGEVK